MKLFTALFILVAISLTSCGPQTLRARGISEDGTLSSTVSMVQLPYDSKYQPGDTVWVYQSGFDLKIADNLMMEDGAKRHSEFFSRALLIK